MIRRINANNLVAFEQTQVHPQTPHALLQAQLRSTSQLAVATEFYKSAGSRVREMPAPPIVSICTALMT